MDNTQLGSFIRSCRLFFLPVLASTFVRALVLGFIITQFFGGCSKSSGSNSKSTTTNTTYSDPSKPSYYPTSNTGDSISTTINPDSLYISYVSQTPCATGNEIISFTFNGKNLPANASYQWYFGDVNFVKSGPASVLNTYATAGSYLVTAKLDTGGVTLATVTKTIVINGKKQLPTAAFSAQSINPPISNNYAFNSSGSTTELGSISYYLWNYGDNGPKDSTANTYVTHSFPQASTAQTFSIQLTVVNSLGCKTNKLMQINIPPQ